MLSSPALALARSCPQLRNLFKSHKTVVTSRAGVDVVGDVARRRREVHKWSLGRGEQLVEPARARDARPLRRHGEDLVRHRDAVEQEQRPRDGPDVSDGLARRRRLVAVETPAYEPHASVRDRGQGRRRHAGRAAAAHVARRVVEDSLPRIILSKKYWYLAILADPADLDVAVVRRADGVVAGPRALVGAKRAALVGAPLLI